MARKVYDNICVISVKDGVFQIWYQDGSWSEMECTTAAKILARLFKSHKDLMKVVDKLDLE